LIENEALEKKLKANYERVLSNVEANAKAQHDLLQKDKAKIESQLEGYRNKTDLLQYQVNNYADQTTTLKTEADSLRYQVNDLLQYQMNNYADQTTTMKTEADSLRHQMNDLLQYQMNNYADQTTTLKAEADSLRYQMNDYADQTAALKTEADSLRHQVKRYAGKTTTMQSEVSKLKQDLSKAKENLIQPAKPVDRGRSSWKSGEKQWQCKCGCIFKCSYRELEFGMSCPRCRKTLKRRAFQKRYYCSSCSKRYLAIPGLHGYNCECGERNPPGSRRDPIRERPSEERE